MNTKILEIRAQGAWVDHREDRYPGSEYSHPKTMQTI